MVNFVNTSIWIERSRAKHGDQYDYSKSNYINAKSFITITCKQHGDFEQVAFSHTYGYGCDKCARVVQTKRQRSNKEEFIDRAIKVHNNKYYYEHVDYITARKKVKITCLEHGDWEQVPDSHLRGNGCPICGNIKIGSKLVSNIKEFINRAVKKHGLKYDYSLVEYTNAKTHVKIICPEHGVFEQTPDVHLHAVGKCPRCATKWTAETDWLTDQGVPNDSVHRQVNLKLSDGSRIRVDGFLPETNTVYEFWGSYFHGHPDFYDPKDNTYYGKKFGDLFEATQSKIEKIKYNGYNLIEIWEHEIYPERFR